jgi:hypothetical protein
MEPASAWATTAQGRATGPRAHGDWLDRPAAGILSMHDKAIARLRRAVAPSGAAAAIGARLALLQQVIAARALVDVGAVPAESARAAMRSDFAAGYMFGLAAAWCGNERDRPSSRQQRATLLGLHRIMFGAEAARRLHRRWSAGEPIPVGAAFGDGLLAAEADLKALCRWLRAEPGGAPPAALLDALPCPAWVRGMAGTGWQ